jgi:hypothetical protein
MKNKKLLIAGLLSFIRAKTKTRCKMNKTKIIFYVGLVAILFFNFAFAKQIERTASLRQAQGGEQGRTAAIKQKDREQTRTLSPTAEPLSEPRNTPEPSRLPEKVLVLEKTPSSANYILVTDVLDGFGGQKYDGGCRLSNFAGGQSSAIGPGSSTNYKLSAGFIYPTVVLCGDVTNNGVVDLGDLVYLISYQYKNGPPPQIYQTGDVNCSGMVELGDVVYLITFLYKGGPAPVC